jgi:UDP-glucose 4-epimerase
MSETQPTEPATRATKRALITGGAGFIGSHLAEHLLGQGVTVTVLDDLSTGSYDNIRHLDDDPRFALVVDSIESPAVVEELVRDVDIVYHLGAAVGVRLVIEQPVRTLQTNIRGTEVVLNAANRWRTRTLIASTSEAYGKSERFPYREDDDVVFGPTSQSRWGYAASKVVDEFLAKAYHQQTGLPVVIARLFNTVGPRQTGRYGMVIPNFVRQALQGEAITVFGDGTQSRTFIYVTDTVDALVALAAAPGATGEVFNVGGDQEITMMDLAKMVKEITESDSEIITVPYDQAYPQGFGDTLRRVPDTTKLRDAVGFSPTVDLNEIIERIVAHHRSNPGFV